MNDTPEIILITLEASVNMDNMHLMLLPGANHFNCLNGTINMIRAPLKGFYLDIYLFVL